MPIKTDFSKKPKINFGTSEAKVFDSKDFDTETIVTIPVDLLIKTENIRDVLTDNDEELIQLGQSIKEYGQLQPIVVAKSGNKYKILMGSRRYKAAIKTGIPALRCQIVEDFKDIRERILKQAVENEQRRNMTFQERENYIAQLIETGMSQTEIANALHKAKGWISEILTAKTTRDENSEELQKLNFEPSTKDAVMLAKLTDKGLKEAIEKTVQEGNNRAALIKNVKEKIEKEKNKSEEKVIPSEDEQIEIPEQTFSEIPKEVKTIKLNASISLMLDEANGKIITESIECPEDKEFERFLIEKAEEFFRLKNFTKN